ncbi:MAG: hypothetical protein K6B65_01715 [Bacilli bacterium]|nr:hypothetical protein [Bacilli bacterium]
MEERTRELLYVLSSLLESDARCLALKEAEVRLNESDEVRSLSSITKAKMESYAYNKDHFGENSELTKSSLHELYLAKKALDEHPLSKDYQRKYAIVRRLYDELDLILISPFREPLQCERK